MEKVNGCLEKFLKNALIVITGGMILIICYQVFGRYVLNRAPSWSEEIARFCLVWMSFLGTALIVRYGTSIRVDFFMKMIPREETRKVLDLVSDIVILGFSLFMVGVGILHVKHSFPYTTEALHIPMYYLNSSVPISGLFMSCFALQNIEGRLRRRRENA